MSLDGCTWAGILGWRHNWNDHNRCVWCGTEKDAWARSFQDSWSQPSAPEDKSFREAVEGLAEDAEHSDRRTHVCPLPPRHSRPSSRIGEVAP